MENKIRDLRIKEKFSIDDKYLNGYAKLCGINATGVYVSLCRHSNKEQSCFPSKRLIAEELAISERSVYSAIKQLEKQNIIKVEDQGRKKSGSFKNKVYFLLDKSEWKSKPQANLADGKKQQPPQANNDSHRRQLLPNKDTHIKDTHIKVRDTLPQKTKKFIIEIKETLKGNSLNQNQVEEIKKFVSYWTEPNKSKTKVRWEMEKTWDTKRRIGNWMRNCEKFNNTNKYKIETL